MFKMLHNTIKSSVMRKMALVAATAGGIAGLTPQTASAHERGRDRDFGIDIRIGSERPSRRWIPAIVEERCRQVWIEPVYRTVCDQVYVKPVYRTAVDRVWVEPVFKTVCEEERVPDCYEYRDVTCYDMGRPYLRRERVLVRRGHVEKVERRVLVCEGHYDNVEHQVCVSEGHYRSVERQELVTPGHYENRTERVEVVPGHWESGYASTGWEFRIRD